MMKVKWIRRNLNQKNQMNKTGLRQTIHKDYLNANLDDKGKAIKKGIKIGIAIIDAERDSDGNITNTWDAEARIIMCCIDEQLREMEE